MITPPVVSGDLAKPFYLRTLSSVFLNTLEKLISVREEKNADTTNGQH